MKKITIAVLSFTPLVAFADRPQNLTELINFFTNVIVGPLVPLFVALALVYFIWGLTTFIRDSDNETARTEGRQRMIWGVIALFVILSVWGLVEVLTNTFDLPGPSLPGLPERQ